MGVGALPCPSHCFAGVRYFFLANSFKSFIQVCQPQCRVTINCKFFTMASIEGINQLLIVSYVLASGSDLVTPSRGSSEFTVHQWRVKAADPTLATGPHSLPRWLAQTVLANDKLRGSVQLLSTWRFMHRLRSHKSTSSWILGSLEFFLGQDHLPAGTMIFCT